MESGLARHEERLSRFMALVLRHKPEVIDVEIGEDGWVRLPDFVSGLQRAWKKGPVTRETVRRIVDLDPKNRYEIDSTSRPHRIRACYGHSVSPRMNYAAVQPPSVLYHGTARRFLGRIWSSGLRSMERQHVHLTEDIETARQVGARRDAYPVVLAIDAESLARDGYVFYLAARGMYLTESVSAVYLSVEEQGLE